VDTQRIATLTAEPRISLATVRRLAARLGVCVGITVDPRLRVQQGDVRHSGGHNVIDLGYERPPGPPPSCPLLAQRDYTLGFLRYSLSSNGVLLRNVGSEVGHLPCWRPHVATNTVLPVELRDDEFQVGRHAAMCHRAPYFTHVDGQATCLFSHPAATTLTKLHPRAMVCCQANELLIAEAHRKGVIPNSVGHETNSGTKIELVRPPRADDCDWAGGPAGRTW